MGRLQALIGQRCLVAWATLFTMTTVPPDTFSPPSERDTHFETTSYRRAIEVI